MSASAYKVTVALFLILLTVAAPICEAGRFSGRRSRPSVRRTQVRTRPQSRPPSNPPATSKPIGWNNPPAGNPAPPAGNPAPPPVNHQPSVSSNVPMVMPVPVHVFQHGRSSAPVQGAAPSNAATPVPAVAQYPQQSLPPGATFVPAGNPLPPTYVVVAAPPQQTSSGLGFGSGLAAGAVGGAVLGHVLTAVNKEQAPPAAPVAPGAAPAAPVAAPVAPGAAPVAPGAAPVAPVAAPASPVAAPASPVAAPAAPHADLICAPMRFNETNPNDNSTMIEVEKMVCYPAPPPPQPIANSSTLAPQVSSSQQPQQGSIIAGNQTINSAAGAKEMGFLGFFICFVLSYLVAYN